MPLYTKQIGQGPDLVLLHGWGFNSSIWGAFAAGLAQHYRVTLIDLPGFGQSPLPAGSYRLAELVERILQVAPRQAHYLGWSLGGVIACAVARDAPARVQSLLLLASSPCLVQKQNWPGIAGHMLESFKRKLQQDYRSALREFLYLQLPACRSKAQLQALIRHMAEQPAPAGDALLQGLQLLQETDLRTDIIRLTCPQTWMLGEADQLLPVALAHQLPDARVVVLAQAGHAPFLSHPETTLQRVREYLDAI